MMQGIQNRAEEQRIAEEKATKDAQKRLDQDEENMLQEKIVKLNMEEERRVD